MERRDEFDFDLLPEFCRYRDEGCELADSCLNCPFEQCVFDEPAGRQRLVKNLRDREIVRLRAEEGKKIKELAEMFGISRRTVLRALTANADSTTMRSE